MKSKKRVKTREKKRMERKEDEGKRKGRNGWSVDSKSWLCFVLKKKRSMGFERGRALDWIGLVEEDEEEIKRKRKLRETDRQNDRTTERQTEGDRGRERERE